jgi:hypothetical protein
VAGEGHETSAVVERCGVAGSSPAAALMGGTCVSGVQPAAQQGRAGLTGGPLLQSGAVAV